MERERTRDELFTRRHEVLQRHPTSFPVFERLHPGVQEYVLLEHDKELAADLEEKKRISEALYQKSREIFRSGEKYEVMREDITAWGEAISDELGKIH